MAITSSERVQIEKLLVLMFNAAPGAAYLSQVVALFESVGHDLQGVAKALDDIPAFQSLHPNFQTGAEFAADFLTPFALQNDAAARDFIIGQIDAGVSKGEVAFAALQILTNLSPQAAAQYQQAKAILENKAAVSDYYSAAKGISQSDVAVLQTVLNGITADPATVTGAEAEIDAGTRGVNGLNVSLSSTQDTVHGTNASDSIHGLFGGADATYTAGDSIDGAGGTDHLALVATGTAPAPSVIVKNIEFIDIQDTAGATFNALLVESNPAIAFANTLTGQTSKVINAALASTLGLAGKGNLSVDYANTAGTTDTARIALAGAGTSASAMSTVDVGDGDTVEAVKIATSGTNFVNLLAGTAMGTLTVSGDGTNSFAFGSIKSTATIDASASTGTNTFDLGNGLSNGDVIKGGSGADTVKFTAGTALGVITLDGVETLSGRIDSNLAMNLGASTGLKTLTLAGSSGSLDVMNAPGSLATVNYQSVASGDTDNDFSLAYAKGQTGDVTLNLGSATSTADLQMNELNFTRAAGMAVNVLGAQDISLNGIAIDDTTKSVALSLAEGSKLSSSVIGTNGNASALKSVMVAVGDEASLNTSIQAGGAEGVTVHAAAGDDAYFSLDISHMKSVGDVMLDFGKDSEDSVSLDTAIGEIGKVTASYGSGASGVLSLAASGNIGNLSFDLASGAAVDFYNGTGAPEFRGNLGDITVDVGKEGTSFVEFSAVAASGDVGKWDHGGNIGDVSLHANGENAWVFPTIAARSDFSGGGGNIGDIDLGASGSGAQMVGEFTASGGSIGDFTLHLDGAAYSELSLGSEDTEGDDIPTVSIGESQVFLGDDTHLEGTWAARGDIGALTVEAGDDVTTSTFMTASEGDLGDVTAAFGDGAKWTGHFSSIEGDVGALKLTAGEDASIDIVSATENGSFGAIDAAAGAGANVHITLDGNAENQTAAGDITLAGGDKDSTFLLHVSGGTVGVIDLHGWLGDVEIHADDVLQGTTIAGGAFSNSIDGTQGADQITTGAGEDSVNGHGGADTIDAGAGADSIAGDDGTDILSGGDGNDTLLGGADGDVLDGGAGNDYIRGDAGVDALTGGAGADMFVFWASTLGTSPVGIASATVTDVVTDFVSGTDKLGFDVVGSALNYAETLAPFLKLSDLLADANDKLNGTVQYYFGVVGGNGYLVHSTDGLTTDSVIQLTGLSNMDSADIKLPPF